MHGKQLSSPTEELKPRRHFVQGGLPFLPKNPFLQVQCLLPGMVELEPTGQARQVDNDEGKAENGAETADNEAEVVGALLMSMGEKNPTGQPTLGTANSTKRWHYSKR